MQSAGGIGLCPIGLPELSGGNTGDRRSDVHRRLEVEPFVQIDPGPEPAFVDVEEMAEPPAEEGDHLRIGIGEPDGLPGSAALAGVEGGAGDEQVALGQRADAGPPRLRRLGDLGRLAALQHVRPAGLQPPARPGATATSRAHNETELRDAPSSRAMSGMVQPRPRNRRASAPSESFPRYPTPPV